MACKSFRPCYGLLNCKKCPYQAQLSSVWCRIHSFTNTKKVKCCSCGVCTSQAEKHEECNKHVYCYNCIDKHENCVKCEEILKLYLKDIE